MGWSEVAKSVAECFTRRQSDEDVAQLLEALERVPQHAFRRMPADARQKISGSAYSIVEAPRRMQSWGRTPGIIEITLASTAQVVHTRAAAVTRQLDEEANRGGHPKRAAKKFGFKLRKNRGA